MLKKLGGLKVWVLVLYSPPQVGKIWGIWGSYYGIPEATFYLLKADYRLMLRWVYLKAQESWQLGFRIGGETALVGGSLLITEL